MIIFKFQAYFNWVQTKFRIRVFKILFKGFKMKKKIKNFIYKIFDWARSGGSFEPPGLNVTPPMIGNTNLQIECKGSSSS